LLTCYVSTLVKLATMHSFTSHIVSVQDFLLMMDISIILIYRDNDIFNDLIIFILYLAYREICEISGAMRDFVSNSCFRKLCVI